VILSPAIRTYVLRLSCLLLLVAGTVTSVRASDPEETDGYKPRAMQDGEVDRITNKERWRYGRKPDWGIVKRRGRSTARTPSTIPGLPGSGGTTTTTPPPNQGPSGSYYTDPNGNSGSYGPDSYDPNGGYASVDTSQVATGNNNTYTPPSSSNQPMSYNPPPSGGSTPATSSPTPPSINTSPNISDSSGSWDMSWLKYVLIFAAVFMVLWFILRMKRPKGKGKKKKEEKEEEKEDEEEGEVEDLFEEDHVDIHEIEFVDEITLAERAGNYRKAVRLRYLNCLRDLSDKGLIMWRINKTNYEYYYELGTYESLSEEFHGVLRIFEDVWYGEFTLSEEEYSEATQQFDHFNAQLKRA